MFAPFYLSLNIKVGEADKFSFTWVLKVRSP